MTSRCGRADRNGRLTRDERRLRVLDAAREVFVENGYHAAAMDEIALRAGVSKPVLYQHFPGKLELYLALLDESTDRLVDAVHAALASTTDNRTRVAATMSAYLDFVSDPRAAFRLVFESDLSAVDAVRDRLDRTIHLCALAVAEVIAEDTGLPADAALLLGAGLTGMAQVAARVWTAGAGTLDGPAVAELLTTLAWRGVRGFPRIGDGEQPAAPAGGRPAPGSAPPPAAPHPPPGPAPG